MNAEVHSLVGEEVSFTTRTGRPHVPGHEPKPQYGRWHTGVVVDVKQANLFVKVKVPVSASRQEKEDFVTKYKNEMPKNILYSMPMQMLHKLRITPKEKRG